MPRNPQSNRCAGCGRQVSEGTRVVVALVANDDYAGCTNLELGRTSAACHPDPACIKAAYATMEPERHLARAIRAGQVAGHDRLSELLVA
jgi:hypothetical protein